MNTPLLIKDHGEGPAAPESEDQSGYARAHLHPREEERVARLLGYEILDDESDSVLDGIAELAALACNAPIAIIALVDRDKTVFRATYGIKRTSVTREDSLCAFAILEKKDLFLIPDTHQDPRLSKNPFVIGEPFVRFYAGAPLWSEDHLPMGSLCVIDRQPRVMTAREQELLVKISRIAMARIRARRYRKGLEHLLSLEKQIYNRFLHSTAEMASAAPSFDIALHNLMENLDPNLGWLSARVRNMQTGGTTGIIDNPTLSKEKDLAEIWQKIDSIPSHPLGISPQTEFLDTGGRISYSHLVVPVRVRGRLVALLEFLYPDHRKTDSRIRDIFDIMATNLSIVAERELIHLELQHQATHDSLTDTSNRSVILDGIRNCLRDADPIKPESAVVFLDVDGFKEINDNFGHEIGDILLVEISKRLRGIARENDIVGRLSGDEFVLILRKLLDPSDLPRILDRIWDSLSRSYSVGELEIKVSNSIGCAAITESEINPNEVLRRAEEAMYLVKCGSRKKYCLVDEEVIKQMQSKRHLDNQVKSAVRDNRMMLLYQPLVDLASGRIIGAEALLRLIERDGSMMEAGEFMESLKRSRYLPVIDEWVFHEVCQLLAGPGAPLLKIPGFRASVNVSPPIISSKGYAERVLAQIHKFSLDPKSFTIEIIESDILTSNDTVLKNFSLLRNEGVHIAVDDFGTGYSNLQYLSTLPIDLVKIDKSFLKGIKTGDRRINGLLEAMAKISLSMGYKTVIEGVEDEIEADYVKGLGCQYAQGYLFGKPMPIDELVELSKR